MPNTDHPLTGRKLGHIPALDGLRAVAALAVVGFHARIPGFANGDIGVDIFFALSGFLITSILISGALSASRVNYREFYRRRALRLLPAYFAVVIVCVLVEAVANYGGTFKGAAVSSVYVANWAVAATDMGLGTLAHTWSLSIEEQFYLVWPALLALLLSRLRWNGRSVLIGLAVLALISWLMVVGLALAGAPAKIASNATPTRAVELLIGGMLAVFVATPGLSGALERCRTRSAVSVAGALAGILLLALIPLSGTSEAVDSIVLWPVISVLTCMVIYASMRAVTAVTVPLSGRFMTGVGKRSYGLYLWHFPVLVIIDTRWGLDTWEARLGGIAITAALVMLSYRYIERPFLERKDARRTVREPSTALQEPAPLVPKLSVET
jgi:peptidoglycan/LPS O-acetylase OafA/YrhL